MQVSGARHEGAGAEEKAASASAAAGGRGDRKQHICCCRGCRSPECSGRGHTAAGLEARGRGTLRPGSGQSRSRRPAARHQSAGGSSRRELTTAGNNTSPGLPESSAHAPAGGRFLPESTMAALSLCHVALVSSPDQAPRSSDSWDMPPDSPPKRFEVLKLVLSPPPPPLPSDVYETSDSKYAPPPPPPAAAPCCSSVCRTPMGSGHYRSSCSSSPRRRPHADKAGSCAPARRSVAAENVAKTPSALQTSDLGGFRRASRHRKR